MAVFVYEAKNKKNQKKVAQGRAGVRICEQNSTKTPRSAEKEGQEVPGHGDDHDEAAAPL